MSRGASHRRSQISHKGSSGQPEKHRPFLLRESIGSRYTRTHVHSAMQWCRSTLPIEGKARWGGGGALGTAAATLGAAFFVCGCMPPLAYTVPVAAAGAELALLGTLRARAEERRARSACTAPTMRVSFPRKMRSPLIVTLSSVI